MFRIGDVIRFNHVYEGIQEGKVVQIVENGGKLVVNSQAKILYLTPNDVTHIFLHKSWYHLEG